jgi:flagellar assembly factor FliW
MKIHSTRFGELEVDSATVLEFAKGIPGFASCKCFHLFHEDSDDPIVHWLQSVDEPDVAIPVVPSTAFNIHYEITLTDEETAALAVTDPADLVVLVVISEGRAKIPVPALERANINPHVTNPILLNTVTRRGLQKSLSDVEYEITIRAGVADSEK